MIYFVQDSETLAIKIGYAADPANRIAALQTGNPSALVLLMECPGDRSVEAMYHRRFAKARIVGEWFRPGPELLQYLLANAHAEGKFSAEPEWEGYSIMKEEGVIFGPDGEVWSRCDLECQQKQWLAAASG